MVVVDAGYSGGVDGLGWLAVGAEAGFFVEELVRLACAVHGFCVSQ